MNQSNKLKTTLAIIVIAIFALTVFGLIWFFFLGPNTPVGLGWYFFSFAAGLTMIVLPCTLPLAFVIVPLSMGKGAAKGLGIALAFGLGVALMLSAYGVIAAKLPLERSGLRLKLLKIGFILSRARLRFFLLLANLGLSMFVCRLTAEPLRRSFKNSRILSRRFYSDFFSAMSESDARIRQRP
jgi:hypothetical protein